MAEKADKALSVFLLQNGKKKKKRKKKERKKHPNLYLLF